MPNYDFAQLSPCEFEDLARDLLQARWGVTLESFKTGRDTGIDLRHCLGPAKTIIQCKHYAASGFAKLLAQTRDVEAPKVAKLAPERYVLVTSVGLTPSNKDSLMAALAPYVRAPEDIVGRDDINSWLGQNPGIERAHFKLWLASTAVLQAVLHNAEACETAFEVGRVHSKLRTYVPNGSYARALEILERGNVVIISGNPGIGKTTLADLLLYAHLEAGYEPVVIRSDLREGKNMFRQGVKQIFYFDDFLGQIFLGDGHGLLGRNQDSALLAFLEMVRHAGSRFVMTTREHILNSALLVSERFRHNRILDERCVLGLADFSFGQKAQILYNHIFFSDLPGEYREELLRDGFFLQIVEHPHFNPRLIEWLTSYRRVKDTAPARYRAFASDLLKDPVQIWRHAFDRQLSPASQSLLLALLSLGPSTHLTMLERAWTALHASRRQRYGFRGAPDAIDEALRELEGSFIEIKGSTVGFLNPSVGDFLQSLVFGSRDHLADLISSVVYFTQLNEIWEHSELPDKDVLLGYLSTNVSTLIEKVELVLASPPMAGIPTDSREYEREFHAEERFAAVVTMAATFGAIELLRRTESLAHVVSLKWRNESVLDLNAAVEPIFILDDCATTSLEGRNLANRVAADMRTELLLALEWCSIDDFQWIFSLPDYFGRPAWSPSERALMSKSFESYLRGRTGEDAGEHLRAKDLESEIREIEDFAGKIGYVLTDQLAPLRRQVAETRERENAIPLRSAERVHGSTVRPEEKDREVVRAMFRTLLD